MMLLLDARPPARAFATARIGLLADQDPRAL